MAFVLANRVQDTTTTTGTGTVTLSGTAPTGYQTFGAAIGDGNTTYYTIAAGTEWEVGIGTYASSGTTLARTTVLSSSNAGSAVNFSAGTKNVFVTYPTERTIYSGGPLGTPSSATLTNATGLPVTTGLANIATASLLGRNTAGTGAVEVLSKATALTLLNTLSTFTPQLKFGGANVGMTQASTGFYIDQGSWVIGWGVISISVKGSSTGVARIYDLPFANTAAGDQAFVAISNSNLREGNYETGNWGGRPTGYMPYGESFIQLTWGNHGDGVYDTDWANNRGFNFSFFYQK